MIKLAKNLILWVWGHKILRFFLVAGLNTLFAYGLFAFLVFLGFEYPVALLIGSIIGILFNFNTYGRLVFKNKNYRLILKFFSVYLIIYFFNYLGLRILLKYGVNNYVGGAILAIPAGLLGFFLNSRFVFVNRKKNEGYERKTIQTKI